MPYKYGAYGEIGQTAAQAVADAGTVALYIGALPVHLVRGYKEKSLVNHPIQINSLADAVSNAGYVSDWGRYSACEAIAAHFDTSSEPVGPIYVINVLDPDKAERSAHEATLAIHNSKAEIPGTDIVLDSIALKRPEAEGEAQEMAVRPNGKAGSTNSFKFAAAYAAAGITFDAGAIDYAPTGAIAPEIVVDGQPCIGIAFKAPAGATTGTLKINGATVVDAASLAEDSEGVLNGNLIHYFPVAKEDGAPLKAKHWNVECEWGGETPESRFCQIGLNGGLNFIEGEDYSLSFDASKGAAVIEDISRNLPANVDVAYETVDVSGVTVDDIVGQTSDTGDCRGIGAIKRLFMEKGVFANLIAAPGWSHHPKVYRALCDAARQMNGHWDAFVMADMPVEVDGEPIETFAQILNWKRENRYTDERSKVCWPLAEDASGRTFHVSTLAMAEQVRTDMSHDGVPMETCGNKYVPIVKQGFGGAERGGFDKTDAIELTSMGVTTVAPWADKWTLWGDHTAAYDHGSEGGDPRANFDVSMRMLMHITNSFQLEWAEFIDQPMNRNLKDTILNREQEKLDALVTDGALIGEPTVEFSEDGNSTAEAMSGNFKWSIAATPIPPLKSATVEVSYTDSGFETYFSEGGEQ